MEPLPEDLDPVQIRDILTGGRFGQVEVVGVTGSTNDDVLERAHAGEAEGLVLVTDMQTHGKGRLGRTWTARPGLSILCSALVRARAAPEHVPLLTLAAGVAAQIAVEEVAHVSPGLKWPNDLVLDGRKLAGILTIAESDSTGVHFEVVGIGMNVNWREPDFPPEIAEIATSLRIATGSRFERAPLLVAYLKALQRFVETLEENPLALVALYEERCVTLGRNVRVERPGHGVVEGRSVGLDDLARLLVEPAGGGEHFTVDMGDVTILS